MYINNVDDLRSHLHTKLPQYLEMMLGADAIQELWNWIVDHFPDTTKMSQSYPNDYLREYGRTVHKGGK